MFHNVLVGVDGRDGGRDAIALARDLGGGRARYVLANVICATVGGGAGAVWLAASCRYAEGLLADERREAGFAAETATACGSSPGRALQELALAQHADLVVVGAGHHRHLPRLLLGDDALAASDRAPVSIAVAPRDYRLHPDGWQTIGVGDDGSARGQRALAVASELGRAHHASVRALSVVGPESLSYRELMLADWSPVADRLEQRRQARLDATPGVDGEVVRGDPVELLLKLAGEVDLLVVASRAQGPIARLLNGSTTRRLAADAQCPVLIVPPRVSPAAAAPVVPSRDPHALAAPTS